MRVKKHLTCRYARLWFLFSLILCGCSQSQHTSNTKKAAPPQIFRTCLCSEPFSLHPAYGYDAKSQILIRALFEGLTRIGADGDV
ncbi:MAG: Oligopeptide-binding protein OppA, partial [Chlamydiae bacterium]|nr:Oligopeptide-binding protein OppA [Chlamydiota bacterium]